MLGIPIGIVAIIIGLRGFSAKGIRLTRGRFIRGPSGRVVGVACIAIGLGIIAYSIYSLRYAVQLEGTG